MTRGDGGEPGKSAAQIEDEIRRTRAELALTLDTLAYRLTPHQLLGKGIDMITDSISKNGVVGMDVAAAIRANRLPLALIGAGAAWLLVRNLATPDDAAPAAAAGHEARTGMAWQNARGAVE